MRRSFRRCDRVHGSHTRRRLGADHTFIAGRCSRALFLLTANRVGEVRDVLLGCSVVLSPLRRLSTAG